MDSMREMVESVLSSPVPVITWVGPMAPALPRPDSSFSFRRSGGDGARHQYGGGASGIATGQKIEDVMEKKIVNDAAAYIRSYTAKRGRNADWRNRRSPKAVRLPPKKR